MGINLIISGFYKKSTLKFYFFEIIFLTFYKKCVRLFESGVVKNCKKFAQPPVPHSRSFISAILWEGRFWNCSLDASTVKKIYKKSRKIFITGDFFFLDIYKKSVLIVRMTYKQLLDKLQELPADRLNDTVTVWNVWENEFTPVSGAPVNKEGSAALDTNVLDYGHIVLELNN